MGTPEQYCLFETLSVGQLTLFANDSVGST